MGPARTRTEQNRHLLQFIAQSRELSFPVVTLGHDGVHVQVRHELFLLPQTGLLQQSPPYPCVHDT